MQNVSEIQTGRGIECQPPTTKRKRHLRLTSASAIRKYLAKCLQRLEDGELDESGVKTRAYVGQVLVRILETSDLEQRLTALEQAAK